MERITEHLSLISDTCSVYALERDGRRLLVDCGTDIAGSADAAGPPVDTVLLTHFHRDQCAAAPELRRKGARIVVPFAERRFLEEADAIRASYDIYDNYLSYRQCFGPVEDVVADRYARDYGHIDWRGLDVEVVPLPGHTFGSAGYLFTIDGARLLAVGDCMSSPSGIHEYASSQWAYMDFQGHVNHLDSLATIAAIGPDLVLPGHGRPFRYDPAALGKLRGAFERLYEMFYARRYEPFVPAFRELSEHVIEVTNTNATTYLVRDGAGHAVCIDCGYASRAPISRNPHRFIDGLTGSLRGKLGIERVEWFIPSHFHDDHLAGYPRLREGYGTEVVCSPGLAEILRNPERYDLPCLLPEGLAVSRVVRPDEPFLWRGMSFRIEQQPGQTIYNQEVLFEADGKRFIAIGDTISGLSLREKRDHIYSFIPSNRTPPSAYREMPSRIAASRPDFILTGHCGGIGCDARMERWSPWMAEWSDSFAGIIDQPHPDMGMDTRWAWFTPYKVRVKPGQSIEFALNVTNHETRESLCAVRFVAPGGTLVAPERASFTVPARSSAATLLTARFPDAFTTHSLPVVADVTWNGKRLGGIAEAVAFW